jgi:hypothetical protein
MSDRVMRKAALIAVVVSLGVVGSAAAEKPVDHVLVVNPDPIAVSVSSLPAVQVVQIDPAANVVQKAVPIPAYASGFSDNIPNGGACGVVSVSLPAGVRIALSRANVSFTFATPADAPLADLEMAVKTSPSASDHLKVAIPVGTADAFGFAGGSVALDGYVLKPGSFADAAVGEAYSAFFCLSRGGAGATAFARVALAGTRTP